MLFAILLSVLAGDCALTGRFSRRFVPSIQTLCRGLLLGLLALTAGSRARAQSICIGYSNCVAVANYSPSVMAQAAQAKWYFAHASVGQLMLEGITNLNASNPGLYQLQATDITGTAPGVTTNAVIYSDNRGHAYANNFYGDWQYSVSTFQTAVSNGWHYPAVNFALTILSFVDIWYNNSASGVTDMLNGYVGPMTNLEAAFPQTTFVYVTMPITTTNYGYEINVEPADDYWREAFNDSLRAWCRTNNRVLFDIADIEAHDNTGAPCTFLYQGQVVQQLWKGDNTGGDACCGEVGDGAHPTNLGFEELMAQGFYALSAALANRSWPTMHLAASPNPSLNGQSVCFTAAVSGSNATPTGVVQFQTNGVNFGGAVPLSGGVATSAVVSNLALGDNLISAVYAGDSNFVGSTNTLAQTVVRSGGQVKPFMQPDRTLRLNCSGTAGLICVLQRTTNLTTRWVTVLSNTVPVGGTFEWKDDFHDLGAPPPAAFYRMLQR